MNERENERKAAEMALFRNRKDAGAQLAEQLAAYAGRSDVIVVGLPRGGVPVAAEIARSLQVSLDAFPVQKLGVPGNEELAFGALAAGGTREINQEVVQWYNLDGATVEYVTQEAKDELARRKKAYREARGSVELRGRIVILVDDGFATGASMKAAVEAVHRQGPARVIVAVPVAPPNVCGAFRRIVDKVVCLATPPDFAGVGSFYADFSQVSDHEVIELLKAARDRGGGQTGPGGEDPADSRGPGAA